MPELDAAIFRALHDRLSTGGWLVLMSSLTVLGSGWGGLLVVPLLARARTRRAGVALTVVLVVTAVLVFVLKAIVRRRRPYLALPDVHALVFEAPTDFSFPSGHAAGSFAFASFVVWILLRSRVVGGGAWRHVVAVAILLLATGIALSRVALGVHFPGDVLVGALLGGTLGALGARSHLRASRKAPG